MNLTIILALSITIFFLTAVYIALILIRKLFLQNKKNNVVVFQNNEKRKYTKVLHNNIKQTKIIGKSYRFDLAGYNIYHDAVLKTKNEKLSKKKKEIENTDIDDYLNAETNS
ncbi:MAG: hypothetical protein ACOCP8_05890 [archaeon]